MTIQDYHKTIGNVVFTIITCVNYSTEKHLTCESIYTYNFTTFSLLVSFLGLSNDKCLYNKVLMETIP